MRRGRFGLLAVRRLALTTAALIFAAGSALAQVNADPGAGGTVAARANYASSNGAAVQGTPSFPTGTTSTSAYVMVGLGTTVTPIKTGRVQVLACGEAYNTTATDNANVQFRYGTGAAPANGAAVTGTQTGGTVNATSTAASQKNPFCIPAILTGLTIGTTYWLDEAQEAVFGGTAEINYAYIVAIEF